MTGISQWLAAEEPDRTEPAQFYVAGAKGWGDPALNGLKVRQRGLVEEEPRLYPTLDALLIEE